MGMHRGGTSLVASLVSRWGACPGGDPAEVFFPPNRWNERGYWEAREVVALNDEILARLGEEWFVPPPPGAEAMLRQLAAASDYADQAAALMRQRPVNGVDVWFLKDPRFSFVAPFWRPFWPDALYLIVLRHPIAVARSLLRRDHMPLSAGLLLWASTMRLALEHTRTERRVIVDADQLLGDPAGACARLWGRLGDFAGRSGSMTADEASAEVQRDLWHFDSNDAMPSNELERGLMSWYESVREHAGVLLDNAEVPLGIDVRPMAREYLKVWSALSRLWRLVPDEYRQRLESAMSADDRALFGYA